MAGKLSIQGDVKVILRKTRKILGMCASIVAHYLGRENYTCCPFLFNSVQIDPYGNIFACCAHGPCKLGNINNTALSEIWKSSIILKIARFLSLRGSLHCFKTCFLPNYLKAHGKFDNQKPMSHPSRVALEYGYRCNLKCKMCDSYKWPDITLDDEVLKKNIDWTKVRDIIFIGGETLTMPKAKNFYIWVTEKANKKADLLTNGTLITEEWAERLVKNSNRITISVNAATEKTYNLVCGKPLFDNVIENIKRLVFLKKRYNSGAKIIFHVTIIPENVDEIPDAIVLANALGCDVIDYNADTLGANLIRENREVQERLKERIANIISDKTVTIEFERENLIPLGLV